MSYSTVEYCSSPFYLYFTLFNVLVFRPSHKQPSFIFFSLIIKKQKENNQHYYLSSSFETAFLTFCKTANMIRLIATGVLLLPAALVMIVTTPIVALLALPAAALLTFRKKSNEKPTQEQQSYRRAIVTGGSSGIGLAVAEDCVKRGFDQVVILARSMDKLQAAQASLEKLVKDSHNKKTVILALSVDVSNLAKLQEAAHTIFDSTPAVSMTFLFCCAGQATPHSFLDLTEQAILQNTKTNQLGATYTVRAMLPYIQAGTIVLCSSVSFVSCPCRENCAHTHTHTYKQSNQRFVINTDVTNDTNTHRKHPRNNNDNTIILSRTDGRSSGSVRIGSLCSIQICPRWFGPSIAHGTSPHAHQCVLCLPTGY